MFAGEAGPWKRNDKNWFYADVTFPRRRNGLRFAGATGQLHINGWQPFTLWLDGTELFKEEHAWLATGPIAEPFPVEIEAGRPYRMVLCVVPTELPNRQISVAAHVTVREATELATDLAAARMQLELASLLADNGREKRLVAKAAGAVDLDALKRDQWPAVHASIERMEDALSPLSDRAKALTVHLIGHSHIDIDWMWTWEDTVSCARRDLKAVTGLMDEFPELTFTHSQVPTYDIVRRMDPDVFAKVRKRVKEGRWENAAGTWVEGDLNMADGESVARHMLYAADWTTRHLGTKSRVLWEPDTFGHPGNMPQLAQLGEFDCYFHMRCNPGHEDNWLARTWTGVDGTPITAFSDPYNGGLEPQGVVGATLRGMRKGLRNALYVWGIGDHGGGLSRSQILLLERYRHKPLIPTIRFSTMSRLLQSVRRDREKLPANKGETYSLFEGCFTSHASIKQYNRRCEGALLAAEAISAMAGVDSRKALREAWQVVLFNQFHDIFDGASVHDAYTNAHARAEKALATTGDVVNKSTARLVASGRARQAVTVINPLGFERTEPVYAELPGGTQAVVADDGSVEPVQKLDGQCVFMARALPAFGWRTYVCLKEPPSGIAPEPVAAREQGDYYHIETRHAAARVRRAYGVIGSYFDKRLQREFVAYGVPKHLSHTPATRSDMALNLFQIIDESPNGMTAWLINDIQREENLLQGAHVELVDAGPVFARLRVRHTFRASCVEEDVLFFQDCPRVDFAARVDWQEIGGPSGVPQLKVSFAANLQAPRVRTEGPFWVTERAPDGLEYPTQKWMAVTGARAAFAIYNDCKYGYDALGGRARLTLLRNSFGPDPEADTGQHEMRFAFEPHQPTVTNGELVRAGMAFNRRPIVVPGAPRAKTKPLGISVLSGESVVCTALRRAEHSDGLLLRLFESGGARCHAKVRLPAGTRSVREVNFLEHPTRPTAARLARGVAALSFRPFEVKTLLIGGTS